MLYHVITIWRLNKKKPTVLIYTKFQYIWIIFGRVMNNFRKWTCNTNNERLKAVKMFIKDHGLSRQYYKFNAIMMSHKNTKHSSVISTWSLDHYFHFFWRLILLSSHLFFIFRQHLFIFSPFVVLWILKRLWNSVKIHNSIKYWLNINRIYDFTWTTTTQEFPFSY